MILEVSHRTIYDYADTVSISLHLLHLLPRQCPHQRCGESAAPDHYGHQDASSPIVTHRYLPCAFVLA